MPVLGQTDTSTKCQFHVRNKKAMPQSCFGFGFEPSFHQASSPFQFASRTLCIVRPRGQARGKPETKVSPQGDVEVVSVPRRLCSGSDPFVHIRTRITMSAVVLLESTSGKSSAGPSAHVCFVGAPLQYVSCCRFIVTTVTHSSGGGGHEHDSVSQARMCTR